MNATEKLTILKSDLQILSKSNDMYLEKLLEQAAALIQREGIMLKEGNLECDMAVIHYAAYLFRKRAATGAETAMPRFLRYELNNLLFSQKGAGS
mgnify:FL=1|jgi:hypothetical protein